MMWCVGTRRPPREAARWVRFGWRPRTPSQVPVSGVTPLVHSLAPDHSPMIFRTAPVNSASIPFPQRTNPARNFLAFAKPIARKWSAMMATFLMAWPRIFALGESIHIRNPLTPVWSKACFPSVFLISLRVKCLWSLSLGCTSCIYLQVKRILILY